VEGSCVHGDEPSGSLQCWKILLFESLRCITSYAVTSLDFNSRYIVNSIENRSIHASEY
jgi:hypothetical protein